MASKKDLEDSIKGLETVANCNKATGRQELGDQQQRVADELREKLERKTDADE